MMKQMSFSYGCNVVFLFEALRTRKDQCGPFYLGVFCCFILAVLTDLLSVMKDQLAACRYSIKDQSLSTSGLRPIRQELITEPGRSFSYILIGLQIASYTFNCLLMLLFMTFSWQVISAIVLGKVVVYGYTILNVDVNQASQHREMEFNGCCE